VSHPKIRIVQSDEMYRQRARSARRSERLEALMLVVSVIAILGALTFVIFGWSGGGTP
jgi:hypothetical protein